MDYDALRHAKKILDEEDRIRKLIADQNYGASHLAALAGHTALHGLGELQSAALAASQHLAEEDRVKQGLGTFHSAALAASRSITEQERFKQALGSFHGAALAANHSIAEEERLRRQIDDILGANRHLASDVGRSYAHESAINAHAAYEDRFRLPKFSQTEKMLEAMRGHFFGSIQERYGNQLPGYQQTMMAMQAPWLDSLHAERSLRGFAELQAIGRSLETVSSFGDEFVTSLRDDLGDWRDPITSWSPAIFEDADARRGFYVDRGLNTELTDFPEAAFHEGLARAGVTDKVPFLVVRYGELKSLYISSEDDVALARTNLAHNWLQRFEFQLRKFIDEAMTKAFGATWPKHRLPNGFYASWKDKKAADKDRGNEWELISYADFTEYVDIICRADNWKDIFEGIFKRKESVRESFQRLYAVRIAVSHARPITHDDELFLYVEVKRLLNAMGPTE